MSYAVWLCYELACDGHKWCLQPPNAPEPTDPMSAVQYRAPRAIKPGVLWCFCHNCEQHRRHTAQRQRRSRFQEAS